MRLNNNDYYLHLNEKGEIMNRRIVLNSIAIILLRLTNNHTDDAIEKI